MNWSTVTGLVIGGILLLMFYTEGVAFIGKLLPNEAEKLLDKNMDFLKDSINSLETGKTTEFQVYNIGGKLYLMTFNKDSNIEECYNLGNCIVLCYDEKCEKAIFPKKINENLVFEKNGAVITLNKDEGQYTFISIQNINNAISIKES